MFGRFSTPEIIGTVVIMVSVNTLRRLALAMTNPFGDDETDYELDYDLRRLWADRRQPLSIDVQAALANADQANIDKPLRQALLQGDIRLLRCDWLLSADAVLGCDASGAIRMRRQQELLAEVASAFFSPGAAVQ